MDSRTRFELREESGAWWLYARTSWSGGAPVGGLARSIPFASEAAAKTWVAEQFGVREDAWLVDADGGQFAAKDGTR